jgi:hypothetical protein
MISHSRAVQITLPEAETLADLYGIEYDLDTAIQLCHKALSLSKEAPDDYQLVEAVITAAVVRYFRCLNTGVRLGIQSSDLEQLNEEDRGTHNYLKDLRDKFVVHSVNPFENSYVTTTATEKDGELLPITSLNPGNHRLVLSSSDARMLLDVARKVRTINEAKVAEEKERLLRIVQARPLEEIHGGDLYTPEPMLVTEVGKSRRTKSRSNNSLQARRP